MLLIRATAAAALLLLTGCATTIRHPELSRELDVFGVELHSEIDHRQIRNITGTDEPCLKGYDRSFDPLDLTVGYGFDGRVRKIVTRNRSTSLFGISPGMPAAEGKRIALQNHFAPRSASHYTRDDLSLTLLIDEREVIFGLVLETPE